MLKRALIALLIAAALQAPAATRTVVAQGEVYWLKLDWVNADVVACGAVTVCNIAVGTLPAAVVARVRTVVIQVTGAAVGPTTVTVSAGRAAGFADYVLAADAKTASIYGDRVAELGVNLPDYIGDVPPSPPTTVNLHLISTGANLSTVTGSTGRVWVQYETIP